MLNEGLEYRISHDGHALELRGFPSDGSFMVSFRRNVSSRHGISLQLIANRADRAVEGFGNGSKRIALAMEQKQLMTLNFSEMGVVFSSYQYAGVLLHMRI